VVVRLDDTKAWWMLILGTRRGALISKAMIPNGVGDSSIPLVAIRKCQRFSDCWYSDPVHILARASYIHYPERNFLNIKGQDHPYQRGAVVVDTLPPKASNIHNLKATPPPTISRQTRPRPIIINPNPPPPPPPRNPIRSERERVGDVAGVLRRLRW